MNTSLTMSLGSGGTGRVRGPVPIAQSAAMREAMTAVEDVAFATTTVLLVGESGTGKEVVARHIHASSSRAAGPWVAVNCAALPADLLESELFGHERGAFTGASDRRVGKIEQAHGGTLLLDEISELPLALQAKLLRVLQEREVDRVGGGRPVAVDVRVIATSNRDLGAMVAERAFRGDLYFRLNVFPIELPPLRARREDLGLLAAQLCFDIGARLGRDVSLHDEAVAPLLAHAFPGNVRELGNLLERAILRCRSASLTAADIELAMRAGRPRGVEELSPPPASLGAPAQITQVEGRLPEGLPLGLAALERLAIAEALRRVGGNRTHAARLLGISIRTLRNKLRELREEVSPAEVAGGQELPGEPVRDRATSWELGVARPSQEEAA